MESGTAEEAKAMLERAITEVRSDEEQALGKFNTAEGDYKQADLYVFCADAESGAMTAHPTLMGQNIKAIVDVNGKALGEEMGTSAKEGTISEIDYMWPRPGTTEPVEKHSYYTRVGSQVCREHHGRQFAMEALPAFSEHTGIASRILRELAI